MFIRFMGGRNEGFAQILDRLDLRKREKAIKRFKEEYNAKQDSGDLQTALFPLPVFLGFFRFILSQGFVLIVIIVISDGETPPFRKSANIISHFDREVNINIMTIWKQFIPL